MSIAVYAFDPLEEFYEFCRRRDSAATKPSLSPAPARLTGCLVVGPMGVAHEIFVRCDLGCRPFAFSRREKYHLTSSRLCVKISMRGERPSLHSASGPRALLADASRETSRGLSLSKNFS